MNIKTNITELIGNTPLLRADAFAKSAGVNAGQLLVKLECMNPTGSAKDRAALYMIRDAERRGVLTKGGTVIEPTSGNTGIGIASISARLGYNAVIVMPDSMSIERIAMMRAYGADVVLTDGKLGMRGAIDRANELNSSIKNSVVLGQFSNTANTLAHYETTGPEIYRDTDGDIDVFVASIGTGGTISGVAKYLKEKNPNIEIIGVEPSESPLLTEGRASPHKIEGIGANFIPEILDMHLIDRVMTVSAEDSYTNGKVFADTEGILVGISSGATLTAAIALAKTIGYEKKKIIALLPDSGNRYFSTSMYKER